MTRDEIKAVRYIKKMAACKDADFIDAIMTVGDEQAMKDRLELIVELCDFLMEEREIES